MSVEHASFKLKAVCCHCLKSGKGRTWTCGEEGHKIMIVSDKIRFPSYKAKNRKHQTSY